MGAGEEGVDRVGDAVSSAGSATGSAVRAATASRVAGRVGVDAAGVFVASMLPLCDICDFSTGAGLSDGATVVRAALRAGSVLVDVVSGALVREALEVAATVVTGLLCSVPPLSGAAGEAETSLV